MRFFTLRRFCLAVLVFPGIISAQRVTDPLPYAPVANPLPDDMDQLPRDSINLNISPIRLNQAGYRPQDKKYFYYVGSASNFSVIDESGTSVGTGTLRSTGQSTSGQLKIRASNNAQITAGGDTRYILTSPVASGTLSEGLIPDLPPGVYRIKVGSDISHPFVIDERVYSWIRDALLKFYGVNRCGDSQSWFHPPCHLKDAVTGGWHDCGDHLKEGATMSYTAAVLGLAAAAFFDRDADVYSANQGITQVTDGIPDILYEAKHGADFILQSYNRADGQVGSMVTSIGGFGNPGCGDDHSWWGRPEYQDDVPPDRGGPPRCVRSEPTSDYLAKYAANLAFVSRMYRPYDTAYSAKCLDAAKNIYNYTKGRRDATNTSAYNGSTIVTDDLAFGCLALLWATEERLYLDELCFDKTIGSKASPGMKALFEGGWFTSNDPLFTHTTANTDWASVQSHVLWGFFRLILSDEALCSKLELTEDQRLALIEKTAYNLMANLASVGSGTQRIELPNSEIWVPSEIKYATPWFTMHTQMEWVWNRYQAGNITEMYYYYDIASRIQGLELPRTPATVDWKADEVKTVLIRMLDYQLGVNPWDISMIYGVGDKNFNHPHHRAANPEGKNVPGAFYSYYPPVGALQGGYIPTTSLYSEHYDDYMHSETGIDGTTNILMPVVGLAKEDTLGPPSATVRIVYVGCDEAIIEIRQSRYGTALVRYGTGNVPETAKPADSAGVLHRITLSGLTHGTTYNFDVQVADLFGRDSIIRYLDEDKNLVLFSFTTLQNCPTNAEITNVKVCRVTFDSAEIFWYTPNGEFDSKVVYGTQRPPTTVQDGDIAGHPVKFHYVKLGGLTEQTTYYFYVESGDSRDDNNGELYKFTTPVMHVDFDVRTLLYTWQDMSTLGMNIVNQDKKSYDSIDVRLYFRAKEGFENDLGARMDIGIVYKESGYQSEFSENGDIRYNIMHSRPVKMEDTYDPADQTYAYYFSLPLWGVEMKSGSRIRLDIVFDHRSPFPPYEDLMNEAPDHVITNRDWSFGSHSRANGDPVDFPGVPNLPKANVDSDYWDQPINYYVTIYRKGEYVWGYSPSREELKTKKTHYSMVSQVTSPLNNPSADYVFYERPIRLVDVSGWATVEPIDGTLNEIWINGVKQTNAQSLFTWNESLSRYDFTVPVPVQNGRNNVDITLFSGPPATCEECYGCAVSNHSFFIEFQGAKQYPSLLVLRDDLWQPISDTVKLDTTRFHIIVTDRNGNQNSKTVDMVTVWIKNFDNGDSIAVVLVETGDSTGVFQTQQPVAVVDKMPDQTGPVQIAMNGGDRVRIWYIDPTDETDSSEAYITSKATFPLARLGWLKDTDGDGAADLLTVQYNTALKANVDSIKIGFPAAANVISVQPSTATMTFSGNIVSAEFAPPLQTGCTGFSTSLYGSGTSYLTSSGIVKATTFQLNDSIGPVLTGSATVMERLMPGYDTLTFTISERIRIENLQGNALYLRRAGADHELTTIGIMSETSGAYTVLCDAHGMQFSAGDSLRFNSTSAPSDLSGNLPHVNNRPVPVLIKAIPARIDWAYYQDTDFNGSIDLVTMGFSKPVTSDRLTISFSWNKQDAAIVPGNSIVAVPGSTTAIMVAVSGGVTNNEIITAGSMDCSVLNSDYPQDTVFFDAIADSAAPVIHTAQFSLFNGNAAINAIDTLRIVFSETVLPDSVDSIHAFNLFAMETGLPYTFSVKGRRMINQQEYLFYGSSVGVEYPQAGDSIWLQPESRVTDFRGNVQQSPLNRRVAVWVGSPDISMAMFKIPRGPNPFTPGPNSFFQIRMIPDSRLPIALDSTSARAIIFDKVGNNIKELTSTPVMASTQPYFELKWDGTNRRGRIVGDGTYLLYLYFNEFKEPIYVGVKNHK